MNDTHCKISAATLARTAAPEYVTFLDGFRDSPEWGSAFVLAPWLVYEYYGDFRLVERHYEAMKRYVDYLSSKADGHILSHGLGDWCDLGPKYPGRAQLTSLAGTATPIYYMDAETIRKAAEKMGRKEDAAKYGKLAQDIRANIGNSLDEYGIQVLAVETKSLDMPDDNKQAVYDRMISERNNIAASYTAQGNSSAQKIKNDTTKEVSVMKSQAKAEAEKIKAEGEAQYMQILSEAYNDTSKADFYNFVRSLDAAKASLGNGNNTLLLDKSSPITQIFYGY